MTRPELTLIPFKASDKIVDGLDKARGHKSRSLYIREALAEKLAKDGVEVTADMIHTADRAGVGGRPRKAVSPPEPKPKAKRKTK